MQLTIIPYEPRYQPDFKRLNVEWIKQYFVVETHDLEQLDHPETHILPNGGQIFLGLLDDVIVGCVAMVRTSPTDFELAKMAVSPAVHGQGVGKLLCQHAIGYARQSGAKTVWLETNRVLTPAISLYERVGFVHLPPKPSLYSRADVYMEVRF